MMSGKSTTTLPSSAREAVPSVFGPISKPQRILEPTEELHSFPILMPTRHVRRSPAACETLAPGRRLRAPFDLHALYGTGAREITRVCHSLGWSLDESNRARVLVKFVRVD